MTAIQQFILVENEYYLVSGLYPVKQAEEQRLGVLGSLEGAYSVRWPNDPLTVSGTLEAMTVQSIVVLSNQVEEQKISMSGTLDSSTFSSITQGLYQVPEGVDNRVGSLQGTLISSTFSSSGQVYYSNAEPAITVLGTLEGGSLS